MANTYVLISSNVLTSSAASVTFSSIPSTYTDLVLKASVRDIGTTNAAGTVYVEFNGTGLSQYSYISLKGNGSTVSSTKDSSADSFGWETFTNKDGTTANTFANVEIYIPSYTVSQNKPVGEFAAVENNSATGWLSTNASLWRNTAAINQIKFTGSDQFKSGSSFYLYGIKNS